MTYALLSMSERHGLLAGIMCAGASPVPACAELTQPPAWFFAAVARPCLWAVGVQLPPLSFQTDSSNPPTLPLSVPRPSDSTVTLCFCAVGRVVTMTTHRI